jgi:glutathione S-transferase
MDEPLRLHIDTFWISPYAFSAFVALREKGLPFEIAVVPLHERGHTQPEYRDRSITARVPALEHGDFWLGESSAIVEYLEDVFAAPRYPRVLPADARERARARQVMAWIRSDLMAIRDERSTVTMFYQPARQPLSPAGAAARDKLVRAAELLLPPGRSTIGSEFSIADADLAFMLQRLLRSSDAVPDRLRAYAEAHWQRPSVRAFVERQRSAYVPY